MAAASLAKPLPCQMGGVECMGESLPAHHANGNYKTGHWTKKATANCKFISELISKSRAKLGSIK